MVVCPAGNSIENSNVMSDPQSEERDNKEQTLTDEDAPKSNVTRDAETTQFPDDAKNSHSEKEDPLPCPEKQEQEQTLKKKYGGLVPKKLPLIAKDHDHAFFDSADWALGKQGVQKSKGPLEALRPKLQPSPHHQIRSRRSTYAVAADDGEGHEGSNDNCNLSDEDQTRNIFSDDDPHPQNQSPEG